MEKENFENEIINAVDLWREISKSASFTDEDYDKSLIGDIKKYLGISENSNIEEELANVSVEELLNAIFLSFEPFSEMLNDLLEVFSKAGAKYTDKNLKIAVDFGKLKVDLENFRTDVETVSKIIRKSVVIYSISDPWGLRDLFKFDENSYCVRDIDSIDNDEIQVWAISYYNQKLPHYFPKQPRFCEEIDRRISCIWNYLHKRYEIVKVVYKKELGIQDSVWEQVKHLRQLLDNEHNCDVKQTLLSKAQLFQDENDFYICTMVVAISKFIEHIHSSNEYERSLLIENFKAKFDSTQNFKSITRKEMVEKIKQINSFLNLPYWKHRYEVYSAWVFTLIVKAFGYANLKYELVNNDTLSFSFGGSHLATYNQDNPLQIWAECRSNTITELKSTKRTNGIQPDYTIAYEDAKRPENAIAVVECKQYKKSSSKNFSEAIIDYVNNRPHAKVFLVNYGGITDSIAKKVIDAEVDDKRFEVLGNVRPQNADSFVSSLESYLFEPVTITLKWGSSPRDLDLELTITDISSLDTKTVDYHYKGIENSFPFAVLDDDCIAGFGPEITTIFKLKKGKKYSIKVNKFSHEIEFIGNVTVKLECKAFTKIYTMDKPFKIWDVCEIYEHKIKDINIVE